MPEIVAAAVLAFASLAPESRAEIWDFLSASRDEIEHLPVDERNVMLEAVCRVCEPLGR